MLEKEARIGIYSICLQVSLTGVISSVVLGELTVEGTIKTLCPGRGPRGLSQRISAEHRLALVLTAWQFNGEGYDHSFVMDR